MYKQYYIPSTKQELVKWFVVNMQYTASSLSKFPYKQLVAIYHKARRRGAPYELHTLET